MHKLSNSPSVRCRVAHWWRLTLSGLGLFALLSPALARAQNTLRWATNYYVITGATLVEIRQSLHQSRPWKGRSTLDGLTQWHIDWRFHVTPSDSGCRCSSFTTQTTITTTLPRWRVPTNVAEGVTKVWEGYAAALGQHEAGHAQFALLALAELHKRIKHIGEEQDCTGLRKKINDMGQQVIDEYRKRDREYDQRTKHGATEGVVLPNRIRRER